MAELMAVETALALMLKGVRPLPAEWVDLAQADGRILAKPVLARRNQPPFAASAMDGYGVRFADSEPGARLHVVGASAAGKRFSGTVKSGQAVRIFTGAPVPRGVDTILLQEDATTDGMWVSPTQRPRESASIRAEGIDFKKGAVLLPAGHRLNPRSLGLAAAAGHARLWVRRTVRIALFTTGNELVLPGEKAGIDQIFSSNSVCLKASLECLGARVTDLGIVRDTLKDTLRALKKAQKADIVISTGGASVGDHDVVQEALIKSGVKMGFWRLALRPGKPIMFGTRQKQRVIGLPGNPVSAFVGFMVFARPLVAALLGGTESSGPVPARITTGLKANDKRQEYQRGTFIWGADGSLQVTPVPLQDSSLQNFLAHAQCLIVRPPFAPETRAGDVVPILMLDA